MGRTAVRRRTEPEAHAGAGTAPNSEHETQSLARPRNPLAAGGWSGLSFIAANVIGAFIYFPLARILHPADFGIFAEANLVYLAAVLVAQDAVAQAYIQLPGDREELARAALRLSVVLGVLGTLICVAAAPLMVAIYRDGELLPLLAVLAPGVLISGAGAAAHAALSRELDFRRKTLPETLSIAFGGLAGLIAAVAGAGVYSLAIMTVLSAVVSTITAWWVSGLRPGWRAPRHEAAAALRRFALTLSGGDLALYARLNTDTALTGRVLGAGPLGIYSIAWATSAGPQLLIGSFANRVGYALFSLLQQEQERLRLVFLSGLRVIATAMLPVTVGAVLVSPDLVPVLLGNRWRAAVAPVMVLFVLQLLRAVANPGASLTLALGRTRLYTAVSLMALPVTVLAVLAGTRAGVTGVAWAMFVAVGAASLVYLVIALRLLQVGVRDLARTLALPAALTAAAAPATAGMRLLLLSAGVPAAARLAAAILAGSLAALIVLWQRWPVIRDDLARIRHALPEEIPDRAGT